MATNRLVRCEFEGCARAWRFGDGAGNRLGDGRWFCVAHWREVAPAPHTCTACGAVLVATQHCGCCDERLCAGCYGQWNALACRGCRERARAAS